MEFSPLLNHLITLSRSAQKSPDNFDNWFKEARKAWSICTQSGGRALLAGVVSDRLGFAFAGGYCAALQNLLEDSSLAVSAFCVSEAGGTRPSDINTTLRLEGEEWVLEGEKSFVTLADHAEWLWVAACTGEQEGRRNIRVVGVPVRQPGITLTPLPSLNFIPEISHARVRFDRVTVRACDMLPGDGYAQLVKPFRTIEDIHVAAAASGLLLKKSIRNQWPRQLTELLIAQSFAWMDLTRQPPKANTTHLALAGLLLQQQQLIEQLTPWIEKDAEFHAMWKRDLPLLRVADKARKLRTENAWQHAFRTPVAVN